MPDGSGDLLIRGATVISMDPAIGDLLTGDVAVRQGAITQVGERVDAGQDAEVIEATGLIALPGFVDTHHHCWNSVLRGVIDSGPLDYYKVKRVLGPHFDAEDAYWATRLALAELAWSGVTTVHDWAHNVRGPEAADAALRAHDDGGLRGRYSYGTPEGDSREETMDLADLRRVHGAWDSLVSGDRLSLGLALRGPWRSAAGVRRQEVAVARELGIPMTIHFTTLEKDGVRGAKVLDDEGLLASDVQLVHAIGTTADERARIAASGATVSVSPLSEMRIAMGFPPVVEMRESGVPLSLSLDTLSLSGNADMFATMRFALFEERARHESMEVLTPRDVLELATIGGARGLGLGETVGSLTPGKRADLILVRTDSLAVAPAADPVHLLVHSAQPSDVDTVIADGRILKRGGRLIGVDADEIVRQGEAVFARVAERATWTGPPLLRSARAAR